MTPAKGQMMTRKPDPGEVTEETRRKAEQIRERATHLPLGAELGRLAADALERSGEMTAAEMRQLAADTITQAQEAAFLLGRLAGLLRDGEGEPHD